LIPSFEKIDSRSFDVSQRLGILLTTFVAVFSYMLLGYLKGQLRIGGGSS